MVLASVDKKQFETTSLEPAINNLKCTECGSKTVLITDPSSGERVCEYCGQVACEDTQASFESLSGNPKMRTSVTSLAHHDRGLATRIGLMNKDASGHVLDTAISSRFGRLRTWDARVY
ncbi:MAG TPA: TFIIB-type zinc ribbon-containing protein, partial [Nitrososphaeraceae archaeon]